MNKSVEMLQFEALNPDLDFTMIDVLGFQGYENKITGEAFIAFLFIKESMKNEIC
jgi:hypothetical protein